MKMKWHIIIVTIVVAVSLAQADFQQFKRPSRPRFSDPIKDHRLHRDKSHKKRGLFGSIPTFSQGIDFPTVKHSILKPFVVDYPVKSVPLGVKIPFRTPAAHVRYPVPVGHHAPVPYPGYGLNIQRPSHVEANLVKSAWPVNCAHGIPQAPSVTKAIVNTPPLPVVQNTPIHVAPAAAPTIFSIPAPAAHHAFFSVPAPAFAPVLPLQQPPIPFITKPFIKPIFHTPVVAPVPFAPVITPSTIIKPGNSVHTSFFATYPKHHFVNGPSIAPSFPVHVAHQPIGIGHVPQHVGNIFHPAPHVPINAGHFPVHIAHTPQHVPIHEGHFPVNVAHISPHVPVNAGHFPINVAHDFPHVPINEGHFPINFPHTQIDAGRVPIGVLPTANVPINAGHFPIQNPFNIGQQPVGILPSNPTPAGNFPVNIGGNFPLNIGGNIPVNDIPVGVGPSPTNVPLGVGQFPIDQNPLFFQRPNVPLRPTFIPTSETGVFPVAQDENNENGAGVQDFGGNDSNPWTPMTTSATIPYPTQPQFEPEGETNFAPTDNTNFQDQNDQNQGYHYQPNSNVPFEEINEQHRYAQHMEQNGQFEQQEHFSGRQNEQAFRNHFPQRQHLPLRRPLENFASYS